MNPIDIFHLWITAINQHDVPALAALMSPDHVFVDTLGHRVQAKSMESGWRGYFATCPDYWIRIGHVLAGADIVLATGEAGGTIDGEPWSTPAAWKAVILENHIAEWQVFADNKPVYAILAKRPL